MTIAEKIDQARNTGKLDLSQSGLTEIPQEVFELRDLKELILGGYKQKFDFPHGDEGDFWGNYNYIETIPEAILNLQKLKRIDLSFNPLKDFPVCLLKLENLEYINVQLCGIKSVPEDLSTLKNFKEVDLVGPQDWQAFAFSLGYSYDDFNIPGTWGEGSFHLTEIKAIWSKFDYSNRVGKLSV